MAEIVRMPRLSDTMTEGTVAKWHKKVGDKISEGDLLADIETDKATMEFESFQEGVLLYIGVEESKTAEVDSILAILGDAGENIDEILKNDSATTSNDSKEPLVIKDDEDNPSNLFEQSKKITVDNKQNSKIESNFEPQVNDLESSSALQRKKVSPLAKKMAKDKGVDLNSLQGSGTYGRIIKRDIEKINSTLSGLNNNIGITHEKFQEIPLSQMRKTIAKRLATSKFSAPHFYLSMTINCDKLVDTRNSINAKKNTKISFNDIIVKAVSLALRENPNINSSWYDDKIKINDHINIGIAVAVDDGLLVPVVRYTDTKNIFQISSEIKTFVKKAKDKKLTPSDWEGSTFTISNLGMYGIDDFTAIINSPDSCILAVGGINDHPVIKNGKVIPGKLMKLTLSCDHRVVDGATGASFLNTLKAFLENPITIFV
jgi:pyruvate dehydrogenase E2 component (dihydrolipoamide acetyltransferase)